MRCYLIGTIYQYNLKIFHSKLNQNVNSWVPNFNIQGPVYAHTYNTIMIPYAMLRIPYYSVYSPK